MNNREYGWIELNRCVSRQRNIKSLTMSVALRRIILIFTLICIAAVLVAPTVDLPDAGLRALQATLAIKASLMNLAILLLLSCPSIFTFLAWSPHPSMRKAELLCVFLC